MRSVSILIVIALGFALGARAETLVLPEQLTEIGEEAFFGDTSLEEVTVPEGVLSIGRNAFSGCTSLCQISIPASVEKLEEPFAQDCPSDLLIQTEPDSAACLYAQEHQMDYQANTVYRALLIGQVYENSSSLKLEGPANDVSSMKACLEAFPNTPYQTCVSMDLTASEIFGAIGQCFGSAEPQDVSLFMYSGHGIASSDTNLQGALLGADGQSIVTASQLRAALDKIPGRKIVILDACYSGNMLYSSSAAQSESGSTFSMDSVASAEEVPTVEEFVNSFISAFSKSARAGLAGSSYFVLTSAAADEECYETIFGNQTLGLFTATLLQGCGYDFEAACFQTLAADANANDVLTLAELYSYARKPLISWGQHIQVYPSDCSWFGILRNTCEYHTLADFS